MFKFLSTRKANGLTPTHTSMSGGSWIIKKNEATVQEIKATKNAIGGDTDDNQIFEQHQFELTIGDSFYLLVRLL